MNTPAAPSPTEVSPSTQANASLAKVHDNVQKLMRKVADGKSVGLDELLQMASEIESVRIPESASIPEPPAASELTEVQSALVENALAKMASLIPPTAISSRIPFERTALDPKILARTEFREAANIYLGANQHRWRERVIYGYRHHIKTLARHFTGVLIKDIHIGHILAYQKARGENEGQRWRRPAGPSLINHEVSFLQAVMKAAQCWHIVADLYKPLELPAQEEPKTMTEDEKHRFYAVAASRPEFSLALWVATITNQTSAAGTELRHLRLKDVVLDGPKPKITVTAATAKNNFRGRTNVLTPVAVEALRNCIGRARHLGSTKPEHFIFPLKDRVTKRWDPTRPTTSSWLRRSWEGLRTAAGLPWLTPHCLRHQCLTEMGERGVPREIIRQFAGHSSEQMLDHYCRIREEKQAAAVGVLVDDAFGVMMSRKATRSRYSPLPHSCPHCGVACAPGLAFCPNGDILDEEKARKSRPWLFPGEPTAA